MLDIHRDQLSRLRLLTLMGMSRATIKSLRQLRGTTCTSAPVCLMSICVYFLGTHCNPGAAFEALRIDESEFIDYTEQSLHSCGDNLDLWKMGEPTGTIRISFGYPTTKDDIDKFMDFVNKELVE